MIFDYIKRAKLPVPSNQNENDQVKKLGGSLLGIRGYFEGVKVNWRNKYTNEELTWTDWSVISGLEIIGCHCLN